MSRDRRLPDATRSTLFSHSSPPTPASHIRPGREDFEAIIGHRERVLPLRRQRMVPGHHGPAIRQLTGLRLAGVDHRLDGEGHALLQFHAGARLAVVQYLRLVVIDLADAMAAVFLDHAETCRLGMLLDRVTDVAQGGTGAHRL